MKDLTKDQQIKLVHILHQFIKITNETDGAELQELCIEQAGKADTLLREILSK